MKYVKLLLIFLVIAGGVFLALNWGSMFGSSDADEDFMDEDSVDIEKMCEDIRMAWAEEDGWNAALYKDQRENVNFKKVLKVFSQTGYNTVNNALREGAANAVRRGYLNSLQGAEYAHKKVNAAYDAAEELKKLESMAEDSRIKEVEDLHVFYNEVYNFVHSNHYITPKLDTRPESFGWKEFSLTQRSILGTAQRLRNDKRFKNMETVPGFVEGLDESTLRANTDKQRRSFYEKLSQQIIDHFSAIEPTDESVATLNMAYNLFSREEGNYGLDRLVAFRREYKVPEPAEPAE